MAKRHFSKPGLTSTPTELGLSTAISELAKALNHRNGAHAPPRLAQKILNSGAEFLKAVLPTLTMFVIAFIFVQRVELDLKRQEFTVSSAEKLKSYFEALIAPIPKNLTDTDAASGRNSLTATALALGSFGAVSAFPFVSIIDQGDAQQIALAKIGLAQAGRVEPRATCTTIASVVDDSTDAYSWETRKSIADVAGIVGCAEAREPLAELKLKIPQMNGLDTEQKQNFQDIVEQALTRINASEHRRSKWW